MSDIRQFSPLWGTWEIDSKLGEGSFGAVWKVRRQVVGGKIYYAAVKHISIPKDDSEIQHLFDEGLFTNEQSAVKYYQQMLKSLSDEIDTMHTLQGFTNIVSYEDHMIVPKPGGIGYDLFLRMELLTPLTVRLRSAMTTTDVVSLGKDIATAIDVLNRFHLVHRDIKPQNIFVNDLGDYKLGDYGTARAMESAATAMSRKGTYNYMAPEIYRNQLADSRVDIYSLGLVLYRLMNGNRLPFLPLQGDVSNEMNEAALVKRLSGEPLPPPQYADRELAGIILKMCAFRPENRYSNAQELKRDLEAYKSNGEETIQEPSGHQQGSIAHHFHFGSSAQGSDSLKNGSVRGGSVRGASIRDGSAKSSSVRDGSVRGGSASNGSFGGGPVRGGSVQEVSNSGKSSGKSKKGAVIGIAALVIALTAGGILLLTSGQKQDGQGNEAGVPPVVELTATPVPTAAPTAEPTATPQPTAVPTAEPTAVPTATPTAEPTATPGPTATPTVEPTATPAPTATPTAEPTATPVPTAIPTAEPTDTPVPTATPTAEPTATPAPTATPTTEPTSIPTETPTAVPTATPTVHPATVSESTPIPMPLLTAAPTAAPTSTPEPTEEPVSKYPTTGKTTKANVNVRESTDKTSKKVKGITKKGTEVTIIGEAEDDSGTLWYLVQLKDGKTGYIRGDMIELVESSSQAASEIPPVQSSDELTALIALAKSKVTNFVGFPVRLIEDLSSRSGPSTTFTGMGTYKINGQSVTVKSMAYDNGGVLWIEVDFTYNGGHRRLWTGAKRLDITDAQLASLPEAYVGPPLGYVTIREATTPRYGPGTIYAKFTKKTFQTGDIVAVIRAENDFLLVECEYTDGHTLHVWIPVSAVQ